MTDKRSQLSLRSQGINTAIAEKLQEQAEINSRTSSDEQSKTDDSTLRVKKNQLPLVLKKDEKKLLEKAKLMLTDNGVELNDNAIIKLALNILLETKRSVIKKALKT